MDFIIFDLEASCEENDKDFKQEIIEIGAVKVNSKLEVVDTFNCFIKPRINPILTNYCKELTHIEQIDVDKAKSFPEVLKDFQKWIGTDYLLCSWGFYDKKQFTNDCMLHQLPSTWVEKHISLKHQFAEFMKVRPCGMAKALRLMNLPLKGTHHRGIDDAKNIASIFVACYPKWRLDLS